MDLLSKMIILAVQKHAHQKCKGGQPYILHPLAVMNQVNSYDAKVVAVAHDLLEDTDTTIAELKEIGCSELIIRAILVLTRPKGEDRISSAHKVSANRLACEVKLADVNHNMDISRLPVLIQKDLDRLQEYRAVKMILEDAKQKRWNYFVQKK